MVQIIKRNGKKKDWSILANSNILGGKINSMNTTAYSSAHTCLQNSNMYTFLWVTKFLHHFL